MEKKPFNINDDIDNESTADNNLVTLAADVLEKNSANGAADDDSHLIASTSRGNRINKIVVDSETSNAFSALPKRYLNRNYRTKGKAESHESSTEDESDDMIESNEAVHPSTSCDSENSTQDGLEEGNERSDLMDTDTTTNAEETNNLRIVTPTPLSRSLLSASIVDASSSSEASLLSDFELRSDYSDDSDSEEYEFLTAAMKQDKKEECNKMVEALLAKPAPNYTWKLLPELYRRQMGLSGSSTQRRQHIIAGTTFENRCYGSLYIVEHLRGMFSLDEHRGCVNSLNFNRTGNLLVSGSDDLQIKLWKWATKQEALSFDSHHILNIFQTKFMHNNANGAINIVSSGRDGFVRHHTILSSGGQPAASIMLAKHTNAVHKIVTSNYDPYEILSAGEDGVVMRCDVRDPLPEKFLKVMSRENVRVKLYSIANHPLSPEFCVCGNDLFVRLYDRRNAKRPSKMFRPDSLTLGAPNLRRYSSHITCAIYNYLGNEILASTEEDIYLFDNAPAAIAPILHKYTGHRNRSTIKGVNFYGPKSEFIVSGSDCGSIFFWDKENESIVQWLFGDGTGAVNCVECHPTIPVLATSGIEYDIKILMPASLPLPVTKSLGLRNCLFKNLSTRNIFNPNRDPDEDLFDT